MQHYFSEDSLPELAIFYLAMTEEYKAALHKGVTTKQSEYKSGTKVVHERLKRIMRYENGKFTGEEIEGVAVHLPARRDAEVEFVADAAASQLHAHARGRGFVVVRPGDVRAGAGTCASRRIEQSKRACVLVFLSVAGGAAAVFAVLQIAFRGTGT